MPQPMIKAEKRIVRSIGLLRISSFVVEQDGGLFCYEETHRNPSQRLGCQCVLFIVCIYFVCFFDRVTPILKASALPSCPLLYLLPCRNLVIPIIKHTTRSSAFRLLTTGPSGVAMCFMVEMGGIEPPSRTLF